ncbi:CNBP [Mytilus edulis]|uniref:CNBP n=1 Tax=Mytilus edulis TaxID=6550 RepID=A0A8S3UN86_MYTED|nr:CNBP [Mytilus edulis]
MATAGKQQNDSDISHNTNSSKAYTDAVKLGLIPKDYLNGEPHVNIHETLSSVKPVFILETDLFGEVKPSPDQYLTHLELYNSIDSCIPKSHLKSLQRVRDDGQILRAIENEGKCTVHKLNRERLRVDGLLTECQTGDRILFCDPLEKPLPRFIRIGKYRAMVFHKDQMPSTKDNQLNLVCNKCYQNGHKFRDCQNDWVCKQCKLPGHKQADCPSFDAQNKESNSMPHDNESKSSSSSQSDTDSDESNTESINDIPEESTHVAASPSTTNVNPAKGAVQQSGAKKQANAEHLTCAVQQADTEQQAGAVQQTVAVQQAVAVQQTGTIQQACAVQQAGVEQLTGVVQQAGAEHAGVVQQAGAVQLANAEHLAGAVQHADTEQQAGAVQRAVAVQQTGAVQRQVLYKKQVLYNRQVCTTGKCCTTDRC